MNCCMDIRPLNFGFDLFTFPNSRRGINSKLIYHWDELSHNFHKEWMVTGSRGLHVIHNYSKGKSILRRNDWFLFLRGSFSFYAGRAAFPPESWVDKKISLGGSRGLCMYIHTYVLYQTCKGRVVIERDEPSIW